MNLYLVVALGMLLIIALAYYRKWNKKKQAELRLQKQLLNFSINETIKKIQDLQILGKEYDLKGELKRIERETSDLISHIQSSDVKDVKTAISYRLQLKNISKQIYDYFNEPEKYFDKKEK